MIDTLNLTSGSIVFFAYSKLKTGIFVICWKGQCQRHGELKPGQTPDTLRQVPDRQATNQGCVVTDHGMFYSTLPDLENHLPSVAVPSPRGLQLWRSAEEHEHCQISEGRKRFPVHQTHDLCCHVSLKHFPPYSGAL